MKRLLVHGGGQSAAPPGAPWKIPPPWPRLATAFYCPGTTRQRSTTTVTRWAKSGRRQERRRGVPEDGQGEDRRRRGGRKGDGAGDPRKRCSASRTTRRTSSSSGSSRGGTIRNKRP
eukprot:UN13480